MVEFDKQEKRIMAILGTKNLDVTRAALKRYLEYLAIVFLIPHTRSLHSLNCEAAADRFFFFERKEGPSHSKIYFRVHP